MAKTPPEDRNLAPEQFPELNRQFYAGALAPHDYLTHRLRGLFLVAQAPDRMPGAFGTELVLGDVRATWSSDEPWDEQEHRDYVSTESTVLLHHSGEALFRLYLAHAESPECPWLAVARLRVPRLFKERIEAFLAERRTDETAASLMNVFTGHPTPPGSTDAKWTTVKDGLVLLLGYLGQRLLDEGPLYNAAKHGLAVCPGAAAMAFGDQDGAFPIRADGPSITYLTVAEGEHGKRWRQATTWLSSDRNIALIETTLRQVSNLWRVAKHRYTGEPWDETGMRYITAEGVRALLRYPESEGVSIVVPSMSMDLLYFADDRDDA